MKKYPRPPHISTWFLNRFCTQDLLEEIHGDLHEQFFDHVDQYGESKAKRIYSWTILRSLRPYLFKTPNRKKYRLNQFDMFKNYLKIAFRNLVKQKGYTLTNIFGLTTGIVSVFLIMIFIDSELSYDKHHDSYENLYRIATDMTINDEDLKLATSPPG